MAGDKSVEVPALEAEASEVIPATHIFTRGGHSRDLAVDLKEAVVVEVKKRS